MKSTDEQQEQIPDWKRKIIMSKYGSDFNSTFIIRDSIADIDARINELESKVFTPKDKNAATLNQQLMILAELGILNTILEKFPTKAAAYELLSVLLKGDVTNIKKFCQHYRPNNLKNDTFNIERNLDFLEDLFDRLGLTENANRITHRLAEFKAQNQLF